MQYSLKFSRRQNFMKSYITSCGGFCWSRLSHSASCSPKSGRFGSFGGQKPQCGGESLGLTGCPTQWQTRATPLTRTSANYWHYDCPKLQPSR